MRSLAIFICLLVCALVAECGSSAGSPPAPTTLTLNPSGTVSIDTGQSLTISSGNASTSWSVSGGGTLSANSGSSVVYSTPPPSALGTATISASAPGTTLTTLTVNYVFPLTVTTNEAVVAFGGMPYSFTIGTQGGVAPFTFTITNGSLPAGLTLNPNTGAISGTPPHVSEQIVFTVKVVDSSAAGPASSTEQIGLTVNANLPNVFPATVSPVPYNVPYSGEFSGNGGVGPYTITLDSNSGPLPTGLTFVSTSHSTQPSGVIGTTTQPGFYPILVDVTDSENPPLTGQVTIDVVVNGNPICGSGSESLLNNQYVFVFTGPDGNFQPALEGGSINFNGNGGITSGTIDMNLSSTGGIQSNAVASGTYTIGADHRGCMSITTAAGTQNFRFSVGGINSGVASFAQVLDVDQLGPKYVGTMYQQANTSTFANVGGNYAFGSSSPQNSAFCVNSVCGGNFAAAGVIGLGTPTLGTTYNGAVTGGVEDFNLNGNLDSSSNTSWPLTGIAINGGGTYTLSPSTGRGTLSYTAATSPTATAVNLIFYVVSPSQILTMSANNQKSATVFAGQALLQTPSTFSIANLDASGGSVLYDSAYQGGGVSTQIGVFSASSTGSFSFSGLASFISAVQQTASGNAGSITVASDGRVPFAPANWANSPVLYLVNNNEGFLVEAGTNAPIGFFTPQTSTTLSNNGAAFSLGTIDPSSLNGAPNGSIGESTGVATFSVKGNNATISSGSVDQIGVANLMQNFAETITGQVFAIDSTGLGTSPPGCLLFGVPGQNLCTTIFYVISPTQFILEILPTEPGAAGLTMGKQ